MIATIHFAWISSSSASAVAGDFALTRNLKAEGGAAATCGHVTRIPHVTAARVAAPESLPVETSGPAAAPMSSAGFAEPTAAPVDPVFKLSPPESRPYAGRYSLTAAEQPPGAADAVNSAKPAVAADRIAPQHEPVPDDSVFPLAVVTENARGDKEEFPGCFELLDEDDNVLPGVSPKWSGACDRWPSLKKTLVDTTWSDWSVDFLQDWIARGRRDGSIENGVAPLVSCSRSCESWTLLPT